MRAAFPHNPGMRYGRQPVPFLLLVALALCVAACSPALDWREYRVAEGGFAVLFPQKPGRADRKLATPAGEVEMHMLSVRVGEHVLAAGYADFGQPPGDAMLDAMRDALVKNIGGRVVSEKAGYVDAGQTRDIAAEGRLGSADKSEVAELRARLILRGNRYIQLLSVGRRGAMAGQDVDMFLSSYRS
jgi:hypothetical protein